MREQRGIFYNIDWTTVILFLALVFLGWLNIYAAVYSEDHKSIFDVSQSYGKQLIWILTAFLLALMILLIDAKFYPAFAFVIYGVCIFWLIEVLILGTEISGSKSWFKIGGFAVQPSEFAKFATNLAIAKYLSTLNIKSRSVRTIFATLILLTIPAILILLQNDTGSALVFFSFVFVLYREGMSGNVLIISLLVIILFFLSLLFNKFIVIGILASVAMVLYVFIKRNRKNIFSLVALFLLTAGFVYTVDYAFENMLEQHQKTRINVLLNKEVDPKGAGYNVNQSKIAIGSGGFFGKGYLEGTQTKYNFVPEQSTDFIFCTVGEEWGFVGSFVVIGLFMMLFVRILNMAERQRSNFSRIYGYGVASILFFHFVINIGMTIGLVPVIGIPLPFFSYGGSSLWAFTILLFIFIKLDSSRLNLL